MNDSQKTLLRPVAHVALLLAASATWGCASTSGAGPLAAGRHHNPPTLAISDTAAMLLECVHATSANLGYTPQWTDNPAHGRFRDSDAQGNDAEWYVAETAGGHTQLIAEAWVDSTGQTRLYVTAYQINNSRRITGVEPGREKNRRLGAFFQASAREGPGNLTADVVQDLAEIRAACSTTAPDAKPER